MSLSAAFDAARAHRAEIIFGTLTALMSSRITPSPVDLPRRAGSPDPAQATHFGQTIPQDTGFFIRLLSFLEEGVDARAEFNHAAATLLFTLGSSFRRHGFRSEHYEPLSTAIGETIDRYVRPGDTDNKVSPAGVKALKDVAYLGCSIMAQGCAEAEEREASAGPSDLINPVTSQGKIVEIEHRNSSVSVVRMHLSTPLAYAAGEPLLVRTPYTPLLWRPLYSAMPSNPDGMLELHVVKDAECADSGTRGFLEAAASLASVGDEWVISAQPTDAHGAPLGLHNDDPTWQQHADKDLIIIAEDGGLAPARAMVLQQVFGNGLGFVPGKDSTTPTPGAKPCRTHLVWGAHNPGQLYELQGLLGLARAFDWLRFTPVVQQFEVPAGTNPSEATGLPREERQHYSRNSLLTEGTALEVTLESSKYLPDHQFIVAGSQQMVLHAIEQLNTKAGVPEEQILGIPTDWDYLS